MIHFLVFYNSFNIDTESATNFYNNLKLYLDANNDVLNRYKIENYNFLGIYDIIKDSQNINLNSINKDSKIFLITLGGDGTLFNSLSLIKKKINSNLNIFVFSINLGSKGFYCFYDKNLLNNINHFLESILKDYTNSNFLKGFFIKLILNNREEYFVGDVVIKNKVVYKPIKLRYYVNNCDKYIEELSDGLLIFSKFGSTGYFLSLYGIFLDLDIDDLIGITFIAPYSIKYRPQIFKNKEIYIENVDKNELIIIKDGQILQDILVYQEKIKIQLDNSFFYLVGKTNIFDKWYNTFYA
ncbi:MAG: hypothetical protein ACPL1F_07575 [bacterium]